MGTAPFPHWREHVLCSEMDPESPAGNFANSAPLELDPELWAQVDCPKAGHLLRELASK